MTIEDLGNVENGNVEMKDFEEIDCTKFFDMYANLFKELDVEVNSFGELLDVYKEVEMEYMLKRHALKQREIMYWFHIDWEKEIGKAKPSEKDKEKWIKQKLGYDTFCVEQLEVKLKHIRRMYETALKHSFEVLE